MNVVTIEKGKLLAAVKTNREAHRAEYEKAMAGYVKQTTAALEENLAALRAGSRRRVMIMETPPEDHTKDYDRAIKMLEMSVNSELQVSNHDFAQYVMDDWGWKEQWTMANTKYLG